MDEGEPQVSAQAPTSDEVRVRPERKDEPELKVNGEKAVVRDV